MSNKYVYEFSLPIHKQGDDFGYQLQEANGNLLEALNRSVIQYEYVTKMYKDLRSRVIEAKPGDIEMSGDTHVIWADGNPEFLESLFNADLLSRSELEDDGEYCENCDGFHGSEEDEG